MGNLLFHHTTSEEKKFLEDNSMYGRDRHPSKASLISAATSAANTSNATRRSGVDKSVYVDPIPKINFGCLETPGKTYKFYGYAANFPDNPGELNQSQMIDVTQSQMMDDTPLMDDDEEEDDSAIEAMNAEMEEIFLDKLDAWFADYAPKLFDLGLAKFLSKREKLEKKKKSDTEESSETSRRRPTKKSRS